MRPDLMKVALLRLRHFLDQRRDSIGTGHHDDVGSALDRNDRDENAAVNLRDDALGKHNNNAARSAVSACGREGAGLRPRSPVKPAPAKQEVNAMTTSASLCVVRGKFDRTASCSIG